MGVCPLAEARVTRRNQCIAREEALQSRLMTCITTVASSVSYIRAWGLNMVFC
jgi:hypothetical protein